MNEARYVMQIDDLINVGVIVGVAEKKALVKVDMLDHISDWIPLLQQANSFKRHYTSPRIGQQVVVLANRIVIGSIFNVDCKEPDGSNDHIDITEYEDGTRFEYDTESKTLTATCVGDVKLSCVNANVKATENVKIEAPNINFVGDINHQGKFKNSAGIETAGDIKDKKGDLTSHKHPDASPR